jgi:hypothetical protein
MISYHYIYLPHDWQRPSRPGYQVTGRKGDTLELARQHDSLELRAKSVGNYHRLTLSCGSRPVGRVEWLSRGGRPVVRELKIEPAFRGFKLARLLAWLALKDLTEKGLALKDVLVLGIMEGEVDPRASNLFVKMGINLVSFPAEGDLNPKLLAPRELREIRLVSDSLFPYYEIETVWSGIVRAALMMPEGVQTRLGPSRGIVEDADFYQKIMIDERLILDIVNRGAAYVSGDYHLNPECEALLAAELAGLPELAL